MPHEGSGNISSSNMPNPAGHDFGLVRSSSNRECPRCNQLLEVIRLYLQQRAALDSAIYVCRRCGVVGFFGGWVDRGHEEWRVTFALAVYQELRDNSSALGPEICDIRLNPDFANLSRVVPAAEPGLRHGNSRLIHGLIDSIGLCDGGRSRFRFLSSSDQPSLIIDGDGESSSEFEEPLDEEEASEDDEGTLTPQPSSENEPSSTSSTPPPLNPQTGRPYWFVEGIPPPHPHHH